MHLPVLYKDEKTCLLQYVIVIEQHTFHLVHNYHWSTIQDGWVCPKCQKEALPFHHVSDIAPFGHTIAAIAPSGQTIAVRALLKMSTSIQLLQQYLPSMQNVCYQK